MDDVLVAAREIKFGSVIDENDLRWQAIPRAGVQPGVIRRAARPAAIAELKGWRARFEIGAGEALHLDWLSKASFMAANLAAGMRAVSINIEQNGATTAGGFIQPGDHVDVIHTYKDDAAGGDGILSETIVRDARVLAIGQNQPQSDRNVALGSSATLELTPSEAETVLLAQRIGQLSLSLRGMTDMGASQADGAPIDPGDVTIVRFGVPIPAHDTEIRTPPHE